MIFSFFVPAFIWAFHELNMAILDIKASILASQLGVNDNRAWLNDTIGSDVPFIPVDSFPSQVNDDANCTASRIRASPTWKALFENIVKGYVTTGRWNNLAAHNSAGKVNVRYINEKKVEKKRGRDDNDVEDMRPPKAAKQSSDTTALSSCTYYILNTYMVNSYL